MYTDDDVARLYPILNAWAASDEFYLGWAMGAESVLDVRCGPGQLLRRARESGHGGRLVGVDPDRAALAIARQRDAIEWVEGTAADMSWDSEFELAVMTGHAFQCLISDEDVHDSLAAIRRSLVAGGRFVFETRNPAVREWETWDAGDPIEVVDHHGRPVLVSYEMLAVEGDVVTIAEITSDQQGERLRVDRAQLRFLAADVLASMLAESGFQIETKFGDWSRGPLLADSGEIVTVACRA